MCFKLHERYRLKMKKLFREFLVLILLAAVSVGALGQRKDQDKRPPKEPGKVTNPDKREPPPQNSNRPPPDKKKPNGH
jgi:hypothetical protein